MMNNSTIFFNRCFDKKRLKNFILWFFNKYGERETIKLTEDLKQIGFQYATKAGISIGVDDLKIPFIKSNCIETTEQKIQSIEINSQRGEITEIERQQQFVDEWSFVSEKLKRHVIQFFKATDVFNPIYMMAFSGARGNISQIRQLIGMRGLMADPQGQILDFPIRSSFREGLTLTEYLISCYGARKGVVDTALRTATSGYLTRRLVDVTQQVVIGRQNCQTNHGIQFTDLIDGNKVLLPLKDRLIGRVLLKDVFRVHPITKNKYKICSKNQEISSRLSIAFNNIESPITLRSPLTCYSKNSICQLCYGWNLAYNAVVSIGEAVGVLAAQSIGEPGTQLTMRTFHTGGVFTGGLVDQIYAPFDGEVKYLNNFKGTLVRTLKGKVGFLTKTEGCLQVKKRVANNLGLNESSEKNTSTNLFFSSQFNKNSSSINTIEPLLKKVFSIEKSLKKVKNIFHSSLTFNIPVHTILFTRHGGSIFEKELIAELSSPSILNSRRLETEQEIFTPIAGQIFFENLVLIEKTKRDGSIQKITYGLGSLWVIAATPWNPLIHSSVFPYNGDFIAHSSAFQKLQVIVEKSYSLDTKLIESLQNFKILKFNKFSVQNFKESIPKPKPYLLNNISLSRVIQSYRFQRMYYQNSRYFVLTCFKNYFLSIFSYKKISFLSTRDHIIQKRHIKLSFNHLALGLNFNFYQNNPVSRIRKFKAKSNFLLYTVHNPLSDQNGNFFLPTQPVSKVWPKLQKPISSRIRFDFKDCVFKGPQYQYGTWLSNYYIITSSIRDLWPWKFYTKTPKNFNAGLPKMGNSFFCFKNKYSKLQKARTKIGEFDLYLLLKNFSNKREFSQFALFFKTSQSSKIQNRYKWTSALQSPFIFFNRQTEANLQFSNLWSLPNPNALSTNQNFYKFKIKSGNEKIGLFGKKTPYIFKFSFEKDYHIKVIARPILLSHNLLQDLYNKEICVTGYLIQNFFISFYYQYFLNLKFNNYFFNSRNKKNLKMGSDTQFKLKILPLFKVRKEFLFRAPSKIKKLFLKNDFFMSLQRDNALKINYKKQQNFKSWPHLSARKRIPDNFGIYSNFISDQQSQFYFAQQRVVVDFLYYKNFLKNYICVHFSNGHFHNLKPRFLIHSISSGNLLLFQKIEKRLNYIRYYSKKLDLNNNCDFENQTFHDSLALNSLENYFHTFDKRSLKSKNLLNPLSLHKLDICLQKTGVRRAEFLQILQVKTKTLFNLDYPIFLKNYSALKQKTKTAFYFNDLALHEKKAHYNILDHLDPFSVKIFQFSSIKKVDFQIRKNKGIKRDEVHLLRIFHKKFEPFSIKNFIYIKFFSSSIGGEIIYTRPTKKSPKINFLILTRTDLNTLIFNKFENLLSIHSLGLGDFLRYGENLNEQNIVTQSGLIIYMDKYKLLIRQAAPFLITSKSLLNVSQNEVIKKGSRLFTFLSHRVKTGDIIQGIPKIEEFFEARLTREGLPLATNLHIQTKQLFQAYKTKCPIFEATQKSFEAIQYLIIDEIQKVYCSQGIYIADKHLEIVIRQMTAKVQVIKGGPTGLLSGELIELDWMRLIEKKFSSDDIVYEPVILGITKSCLETDSFISAASFQETTRILTKAAIRNKIDFIRGLKQNVILGNLVPAGTGFFSPLYLKYLKTE